jgi:dTDP-4-dehydrorhamnose 3,5-epimerase
MNSPDEELVLFKVQTSRRVMPFQPLSIEGAWVFAPQIHEDSRGSFLESFRLDEIKSKLGRDFAVKQVNQSTSAKGVIRGIHSSKTPPGQAKYITCPAGAIWDVVVDLRPASQTFGEWEAIELSASNAKAVLISEGLGHGFLSLEDGSVASYLCNEVYEPNLEFGINPLDKDLAIDFQSRLEAIGIPDGILSKKDSDAPSFAQARELGLLG